MPVAASPIGTQVAGYTLEEVLGRGGMSVVYGAVHPDRPQTVALKLIAPDASWSAEARDRLQHEARLASAVAHRHILPVYEAGEHDGRLFVAMRRERTDLGALLRGLGRLTPPRAIALVVQVASALDAAHAHGLVHRDIKPSNVLLGEEEGQEAAYLADFGVARVAFADAQMQPGDLVGTVGYAAPEQIRGETVDARSDVYALGCLLYECLTGRVPFDRRDSLAILWAHLHEPAPAPTVLVPALDPRLDDVIGRALAKTPSVRFGSAGALARAAEDAIGARRREPPPSRPRRPLPTGTVTFLFTDVEGSTRLLHELGDRAYGEALTEHRESLRAACAEWGGVEVDTQGDAFFFSFGDAASAVGAAAAVQVASAPTPIRVRVGVHTGTPHVTSEGYVGVDVHRAARIAAAGHGGQVLVSHATVALVGHEGALRPLGAHRLKDFDEPVTLFQLGDGDFPPLKTIANTNLPTPASSFLGRERELHDADALLQSTRLLTVVGPGGVGKTRFAVELARRAREERFSDFADGVFACFLAPLRDPSLVLGTLAQVLSVREEARRSAVEMLNTHLEERRVLLLLDNLEHLTPCASELAALLAACPGLTLLVTSRERLRIDGELVYDLPALSGDEDVALFCERARVEPSPSVRELCARLEGLPLAIELAAARMSLLSPEQLLERLAERLDLLRGVRAADPRQQTLRATIEWSYDLLAPEEQQLFARLSVFAGGCTLEAAEEVCDADLDALESLLDKSLLRRLDGRFSMLATIREYAAERLRESVDEAAVRRRHAEFLAQLAEAGYAALRGAEAPQWMRRYDAEQDNFRAALAFLAAHGSWEEALSLSWVLARYWFTRGLNRESRHWLETTLAQTASDVRGRSRALVALSLAALEQGDLDAGSAAARAALELDRTGDDHANLVNSMLAVADVRASSGDIDGGAVLWAEAAELARARGLRIELAIALYNLGHVARHQQQYELAETRFEETLTIFSELRDLRGQAGALFGLVHMAVEREEIERAFSLLRRATDVMASSGYVAGILDAVDLYAGLFETSGEAEPAARLFGAHYALSETLGRQHAHPVELASHDETLDRIREALGDETYGRVWSEGTGMTLDEAVAYALGAADR
jgi:predicted ATPase/class 3 adenylate cyclase